MGVAQQQQNDSVYYWPTTSTISHSEWLDNWLTVEVEVMPRVRGGSARVSACVPNGTTYTPTFDGEELPHVTGVQWYPGVIVAVRDTSLCFGSLSEAEESLFVRMFQVLEQRGLKDAFVGKLEVTYVAWCE